MPEIGLVVWAEGTAEETLKFVTDFGLRSIQLGVPPTLNCASAVVDWKTALSTSPVIVTSAVCSYAGEDYSDLATVHESVGFTTGRYRAERIARTKEVARFAHELGVRAVSCHIGFIPAERSEPLYGELVALTQEICTDLAANGQDFVLETGQESAKVLLGFLADVGKENLKVNFDPANMVLYGSGDPLEALGLLQSHVLSVHCKDGRSPVPGSGLLGKECALGDGEVDFPGFLKTLKGFNYSGVLTIEREEQDPVQRAADIRTAISRLRQWMA
ncbi:MAG: sugar phosphate isomerase/epimerase [Acidobacteria bacterium]|nr:sugar phosphate isomerase/epimerase [Acidobacteriota bacterium]